MMHHEEKCNCPVCNNEIREERQFASLQISEDKNVLFDVEEFAYFDKWMSTKEKKQQPEYENIHPDEEASAQLVYAVLMPANENNKKDLCVEIKKCKNYAMCTLEDEKLYVSGYADIEVFKGKEVYSRCIPCALLLYTSLDLKKKKEYGFGYTMFLKHSNQKIFDNLLCREFVIVVRDIEETYNPEDEEHWKDYINEKNMLKMAREIF